MIIGKKKNYDPVLNNSFVIHYVETTNGQTDYYRF